LNTKNTECCILYVCLPQPLAIKVQILAGLAVWKQVRVSLGKNYTKSLECNHTECIQTLMIRNGHPVTQNTVYHRGTFGRRRTCLFCNTFSISHYV